VKAIGIPDWLDIDKDAIVDDIALLVFHGTTEECLRWLMEHLNEWDEHFSVVCGSVPAVMGVLEYIRFFGGDPE
jgi:hypothetical protein